MLFHDSADLRALEERRSDMMKEVRAQYRAEKAMARRASISFVKGSPAKRKNGPWWSGICVGCGDKLERLGRNLAALGKKLRNAAEAEQGRRAGAGFQV